MGCDCRFLQGPDLVMHKVGDRMSLISRHATKKRGYAHGMNLLTILPDYYATSVLLFVTWRQCFCGTELLDIVTKQFLGEVSFAVFPDEN